MDLSNKKTCGKAAVFRYTWPGKDESFCCIDHSIQIARIANAIGLHLQLVSILDDSKEEKCSQVVKDKTGVGPVEVTEGRDECEPS